MERGQQTEVTSTFTDKLGNVHVGMLWPIVDGEGIMHVKFRENVTGRLFPIEWPSIDKKRKHQRVASNSTSR